MRDSRSIREGFLEYFRKNAHERVSSYSLIPPADPSLLFVNAGMVQFKDVFIGLCKTPYARATTSQKCLRVSGKHNDLENVGRTPRHHTFFEMLGNFSFGDYFKKDAIRFGWEFLTEVAGLDPDRLWVTIHPEDDEAYGHWREEVGVPAERIVRDAANVWSMGDTGPNGPCSEIHWDKGEAYGPDEVFEEGYDGDRFVEIWNLVFMQYDRSLDGVNTPLPKPSIDTGMGLERLAAILQGVDSNYDTDLFLPLIQISADASDKPYGQDPDYDVAYRVIADHARATAFLICDGIYPENEGRGYVLRRVMRRAIRFGRKIGLEGAFFHRVVDGVVDLMADAYPELPAKRRIIEQYVLAEEERFGRTLDDGLEMLDRSIRKLKPKEALGGELVFKMYDTHGFPLDLTQLIAEEQGVEIDVAGFEAAMARQRERGRASWKEQAGDRGWADEVARAGTEVAFVGYDQLTSEATVVALFSEGRPVDRVTTASPEVVVITDRTPFYGEAGGQAGDTGIVEAEGLIAQVTDAVRPVQELTGHQVSVTSGEIALGDRIQLKVDAGSRARTRGNHTGTHLLQNGLRAVLGDHVKQRGSLVAPDRLRFDFSHFAPLSADQIQRVEAHVNQMIQADHPVETGVMSLAAALESGAIAFFEEKYSEDVRVVSVAGESVELCGGTHVGRTGEIGPFVIAAEAGISSGVRRVEALTGPAAVAWFQEQRATLAGLRERFPGAGTSELVEKVEALQQANRELDGELAKLRTHLASGSVDDDIQGGRRFGEQVALVKVTQGLSMKELADLSDRYRDKMTAGAILLQNQSEGGAVNLLIAVKGSDGLHAGQLMREVASAAGGKGGGRPDIARGGAPDAASCDLASETFYRIIQSRLGG
jgi:alanyl-tRNA synthetase